MLEEERRSGSELNGRRNQPAFGCFVGTVDVAVGNRTAGRVVLLLCTPSGPGCHALVVDRKLAEATVLKRRFEDCGSGSDDRRVGCIGRFGYAVEVGTAVGVDKLELHVVVELADDCSHVAGSDGKEFILESSVAACADDDSGAGSTEKIAVGVLVAADEGFAGLCEVHAFELHKLALPLYLVLPA